MFRLFVFLRCLKCCFWCLEKFLKFLNKNAYIMVSTSATSWLGSVSTHKSWKCLGTLISRYARKLCLPFLCFLVCAHTTFLWKQNVSETRSSQALYSRANCDVPTPPVLLLSTLRYSPTWYFEITAVSFLTDISD